MTRSYRLSCILRQTAALVVLAALTISLPAAASAELPDGSALLAKYDDQITNVYAGADAYRGELYTGVPRKNFALLMMTDTHGDTERIENAIAILNACDAIEAAIHLGDVEYYGYGGGDAPNAVSAFAEAKKPVFAVLGNHDSRERIWRECTVEQATQALLKPINTGAVYSGRGYGYQDFDTYGIRLILLNCYDFPDDRNAEGFFYYGDHIIYLQDQISWLVSALSSTPDDYTVIIAEHSGDPVLVDQSVTPQHIGAAGVSNTTEWRQSGTYMDGTIVADIVDAFINRTSLYRSYAIVPAGNESDVSVSADFSSRSDSRFACYIRGHVHCQGIGHIAAHPDQVAYINDSSALFSGGNMWTSYTSFLPRAAGQKSEDLLTVLCVDTANRSLNFVRIGAHINMFGEDSGFIHYTY